MLLLLLMLWLPQLLLLGMVGLERCAEVRAEEAEPVAPTLEFLVLKGATELCLQMKKKILVLKKFPSKQFFGIAFHHYISPVKKILLQIQFYSLHMTLSTYIA